MPPHNTKKTTPCGACGSVPSPSGALGGLAWGCSDPACFMFEIFIHFSRWDAVQEGLEQLKEDRFQSGYVSGSGVEY